MRAKFVNEAIKHLGPRSDKEVKASLKDLTPNEKLITGSEQGLLWLAQDALAAGANVHAADDDALRSASSEGHTEVVKVLLAAGANVHAKNDEALRWASSEGHIEVVRVLKQAMKEKKVNEAIKHLSPKSKEDIQAVSDKIKAGFESRKGDIIKLANSIQKKYRVEPHYISYPSFSPLYPDRKAVDFSADFEFKNAFSFYIRTQEFSEGFEVGYSVIKMQGHPVVSNWDEVDNIGQATKIVYSYIRQFA